MIAAKVAIICWSVCNTVVGQTSGVATDDTTRGTVTRDETTSASVLIGRGVVLRPPRESDKADRLAIGRHAEYVRLDGGNTRDLAPLTEDEVAQWYERISSAQYGWVIDIGGRAVGTTRLKNHDAENRSADFVIGIADPALWGRGY